MEAKIVFRMIQKSHECQTIKFWFDVIQYQLLILQNREKVKNLNLYPG